VFTVIIGKPVKRITLSRVVVSQIAFFGEVNEVLLLALYQNQLWLEDKLQRDPCFFKKYGTSVLKVSDILKSTNLSHGVTPKLLANLKNRLRESLSDFLIPQRNLSTELSKIRHFVTTRPYHESGTPVSMLPPKKVIGKGYGDKGTAKDLAQNGNPGWQEVGSVYSNYERQALELIAKLATITDTKEQIIVTAELNEISQKLKSIRRDPTKGTSNIPKVSKGDEDKMSNTKKTEG
jgi:hypothetical protein